ncbi:hypothetical protein SBOR_2063 [Sclerotinia borealis F-4128]|uniref:Uncharacterized protein n=1 Tax=Sclerotinia borealis (strain F-4128) TaxID=1432307 RepID=W9CNU1_SCLBF|nr:hypothetical protein SBOR_2063 [Sclerotinia borealis F-4128]
MPHVPQSLHRLRDKVTRKPGEQAHIVAPYLDSNLPAEPGHEVDSYLFKNLRCRDDIFCEAECHDFFAHEGAVLFCQPEFNIMFELAIVKLRLGMMAAAKSAGTYVALSPNNGPRGEEWYYEIWVTPTWRHSKLASLTSHELLKY